jgi:hypothetical protein
MAEYPKLVIVIDPNGVETTRIVASSIKQQKQGENLLNRILIALTLINGICGKGTEKAKEN